MERLLLNSQTPAARERMDISSSPSASSPPFSRSSSIGDEATPRASLELDLPELSDRDLENGVRIRSRTYEWATWSRIILDKAGPYSSYAPIKATGKRLLVPILPTFLHPTSTACSKKVYTSTDYLHGVRGIACWSVFNGHVLNGLGFHEIVSETTPVLASLEAGRAAVAIFFIVSGFSISYKASTQMHRGDLPGVYATITSSIFRRYGRLYMPIFILTSIFSLFAFFGITGVRVDQFGPNPQFGLLREHALHVYYCLKWFANPLRSALSRSDWHLDTQYDVNTWTIPFEFLGSMAVFLCLLGGAKLCTRIRIFGVALLIVVVYLCFELWAIALFLIGMLLGELHSLCLQRKSDATESPSRNNVIWKWIWRGFCVANYVAALYLMGLPKWFREWRPGGSSQLPYWSESVSAAYLMVVLEASTFLQIIYSNRWSMYSGKISYCFYLIHSTTHKTFGCWIRDRLYNTNLVLRACCSYILLLLVTIYLADLATRLIDEPVVDFNRWLYVKMTTYEATWSVPKRWPLAEYFISRQTEPAVATGNYMQLDQRRPRQLPVSSVMAGHEAFGNDGEYKDICSLDEEREDGVGGQAVSARRKIV